MIQSFRFNNFTQTSSNKRVNGYSIYNSVVLTGRNICYPNTLIFTENTLINPYDEMVMSLQKESFYDNNIYTGSIPNHTDIYEEPCFFFIYNVDNYFHFLYDSLPILEHYFQLKKVYSNLKLLVNTSHPSKEVLPQFVLETFELLEIDLIFPTEVVYKTLIIGSSLTHGKESNSQYSPHSIWKRMNLSIPTRKERIYISRRPLSLHPENIGTNYTQKRRCVNEDALVKLLYQHNIKEVFCEDMTMEDKIQLFANAELVIGFIGGGMANCLFSPPSTRVLCLNTPTFLNVNKRFQYTMNHTDVEYIDCCSHILNENVKYTLYTRVRITNVFSEYYNCIGEIEEYNGDIEVFNEKKGNYTIKISQNDVAGFSQDFPMKTIILSEEHFKPIDNGLNSPFLVDLNKILDYL